MENNILTREEVFNNQYRLKNKDNYSIELLVNFLEKSNLVSLEQIDTLKNSLSEAIIEYSYQDIYDEDDIEYVISENTKNIIKYIDFKLSLFNNAYNASSYLFNTNLNILIKESEKAYMDGILNLRNNIKILDMNTKEYRKYFRCYNEIIDFLINYNINNKNDFIKPIYYSLINGESIKNEYDIKLNEMLNLSKRLLEEDEIIRKFEMEKIIRISKKLSIGDNIASSILYTYVFSSIYLDNPENLDISNNTYEMINFEIENNSLDIDDVKQAIENGNIKFSDKNLKYIQKYFYPSFSISKEYNILKNKLIKN